MKDFIRYFGGEEALKEGSKSISVDECCEFKVPYSYNFSSEAINELEEGSFMWPVAARAHVADDMFAPSKRIDSLDELLTFVSRFPEDDTNFSIQMVPSLMLLPSVFFYVSKDYVLVHNTESDESLFIVENNLSIFLLGGLDANLVYRIAHCGEGWIIDNVIEYDDPRLSIIKNPIASDSVFSIEDHAKIIKAYRQGFFSIVDLGSSSLVCDLPKVPIGGAHSLGFTLGTAVASRLRTHLGIGGISCYLAFRNKLCVKSGLKIERMGGSSAEFFSMIEIHNEIQGSTPDNFMEVYDSAFEIISSSAILKRYSYTYSRPWKSITHLMSVLGRKIIDSYLTFKIEDPERLFQTTTPGYDFEVTNTFEFDLGQFRVSSDKSNLRIQFKNVKYLSKLVTEGGESPGTSISTWSSQAPEINFDVRKEDVEDYKSYIDGLNALSYENASTYKTSSMLYAPMVWKEDAFYSSENGCLVLPGKVVLRYLSDKTSIVDEKPCSAVAINYVETEVSINISEE